MRQYGMWAGRPSGVPESKTRCIVEIYPSHTFLSCQCTRKRGHGPGGLYCKQHGKMVEAGRHVNVPEDSPNGEKQ